MNIKPIHVGMLAGLAFVFICVVVLLGFVLTSGSNDDSAQQEAAAERVDDAVDRAATAIDAVMSGGSSSADGLDGNVEDLDSSMMLSIPGSTSVESITVSKDSVASESCSFDVGEIKSAISAVEEYGGCGFVFIDLNTGRGLAYNADEEIYIASAAKAVMTLYALTNGAGANEWERYNIEEAITYSDNDAYEGFAYNYSGDGYYGEWLNTHGVWFDDYVFDLYPPMSARSLASFWIEILQYVEGESEHAQWLAGLLGSTETSFIRDAVSATGAQVINKGGWIGEGGYASVSDAGIIKLDGHTYLMVIVTGQFDEGMTEANVTELARALFDVRDQL